jgi:hypothetical protein
VKICESMKEQGSTTIAVKMLEEVVSHHNSCKALNLLDGERNHLCST